MQATCGVRAAGRFPTCFSPNDFFISGALAGYLPLKRQAAVACRAGRIDRPGLFSVLRNEMAERLSLPVLPMRETVVFPGVAVPISAGRPGTLEAIEQVLEGDRRLFAVCQRENVDEPTPELLYEMGVIVTVLRV